ncbi:MAG: hypothetical protein JF616_03905 [Fibrobacteres bacterium]|jgi:hypothetical protein|nr:hypothetical protein [Fibrobacterota bacterium]
MRTFAFRTVVMAMAAAGALRAQPASPSGPQKGLDFHGGATFGYGELVHSSDTSQLDYSGNRIQNVSARFSMRAGFSENLSVTAGMGIVERHYLSGRISDNGGRTPFVWSPFVTDASLEYAFWNAGENRAAITAGYFPYTYNPDIKDLGLYLLRGPVHPGVLVSGYDSKYTQPIANTMGLRVQLATGPFEQNLIIGSEIENYPLFDISPAYIASVKIGAALRIAAGVNFYHLIPIDRKLTSPDTFGSNDLPDNFNGDPNSRTQIYVDPDTAAHDTTFLSFAGTKLMASASFDPKAFFSSDVFGREDLKLYGEIAVIGLDHGKAYDAIYGDLMHRMPVMVGFNFPAFGLLDHLSLEVEWYGSKVKDDLGRLQATTGNYQSPLPVVNSAGLNLRRDDWKWCLQAAKTFGQLRISLQAADDHSRSGGTLTSPGSEWETYFVTPKDFYWLARLGFFF